MKISKRAHIISESVITWIIWLALGAAVIFAIINIARHATG
jgi:hypothetical protein